MPDVEKIITRDVSSGVVHLRYRINEVMRVDERCNTDQAGEYEIIPAGDVLDAMKKCGHCFPENATARDSHTSA